MSCLVENIGKNCLKKPELNINRYTLSYFQFSL